MTLTSDQSVLLELFRIRDHPNPGKLIADANWYHILPLALHHRVAPLLYSVLGHANMLDETPSRIVERLRVDFYSTLAANTRILNQLKVILAILQNNDIQVILLKGTYLAYLVYETPAVRPMRDIDLLVKPNRYVSACQILLDSGFYLGYDDSLDEAIARYPFHISLTAENDGTIVEIHRSFETHRRSFDIDMDDLFDRAPYVYLDTIQTKTLPYEEFFVQLCTHAALHHQMRFGLLPLFDLDRIIKTHRPSISWNEIVEISKRWRVNKAVWIMCSIARELLGSDVPNEFIESNKRIANVQKTDVLSQATNCILTAMTNGQKISPGIARVFGPKKPIVMLRNAVLRIFPKKTVISRMYSISEDHPLLLLYYIMRILFLFRRYHKIVWRLLFKDINSLKISKHIYMRMELYEWMCKDDHSDRT